MFSHTEEVMIFLFPFWGHLAYCGSTFLFSVLHASQSKCLPQLTAGKGLWEPPFFFCLPSSTTGKYEADPVYVCRNLKMSWYAVVIKEESRAVYPGEYRALNQKASWALQADCGKLFASKCKAKISATESVPCTLGIDKMSELCLYKKSGAFFLRINLIFEICFPEAFAF